MLKACYMGKDGEKFYQHTMIDEATKVCFICAYQDTDSYFTIDFVERAIRHFGYASEIIQTDNGSKFTHTRKTEWIHPSDELCEQLHIVHKAIRIGTPCRNS